MLLCRRHAWTPLALTLTVAFAATLPAQQPDRQGFWGSIGGGFGAAKLGCDNCGSTSRENSFAGFLVLGAALTPSVLIGLEVDGWLKTINGDPLRLGAVTGMLQWYPSSSLGLFVKGGAGLSYARGDLRFPTSVFLDDAGLGYLLGVGFDVPVGSGLAVTPVASLYGGNIGDVQNAEGVDFTVFQLMVALTLQ